MSATRRVVSAMCEDVDGSTSNGRTATLTRPCPAARRSIESEPIQLPDPDPRQERQRHAAPIADHPARFTVRRGGAGRMLRGFRRRRPA